MEQSLWENWHLQAEMGHDVDDFLEECHTTDDDDFLRDILQQPDFSSESDDIHQSFHHLSPSPPMVHNNLITTATTDGSSISSDETSGKRPPRTFILSFDSSTIIPATPEQQPPYQVGHGQIGATRSSSSSKSAPLSSKKRSLASQQVEPKVRASQGGKKSRNSSQTLDHIMAERKRRQELTERFIALSATIPGLKKTDKASILREAINYVKQLQERVTELEKRSKKGTECVIFLKKTDLRAKEDSICSETSSEGCPTPSELLPDVEARVLEKDVLIEIHCEKSNGIELKILNKLENLHLTVTGSSVLPFGNSTLGITIIAQMGDAYRMTGNDLVKNLREVILSHVTDPY